MAKYHCETHQQLCYVLPGHRNEPGGHVKLRRGDLLLWSEELVSQIHELALNLPVLIPTPYIL